MKTIAVYLGAEYKRYTVLTLVLIMAVGAFLRLYSLGNPFLSSDESELAVKVLRFPGFSWMVLEQYGLIISFVVKMNAAFWALIGVTVTEFFWKLPIALAGVLQIPVSFFFLRRVGASVPTAIIGAGFVAVLPSNIFQSRYLWGYEIFGNMFLTLSLWAFIDFYETPAVKSGIIASFCSGLYMISHGYFIPYFPLLVVIMITLVRVDSVNVFVRFLAGFKPYCKNYAWLGFIILFPFTLRPWIHFFHKKTSFGFYLFDHLRDLIGSAGVYVAVIGVVAVGFVAMRRLYRPVIVLLFMTAGAYLGPLFLGAPKGATVANGYMLIGINFTILFALLALDEIIRSHRRAAAALAVLFCFGMAWGVSNVLFYSQRYPDISLIKTEDGERGIVDDRGLKAAAYIIRKYAPETSAVFGMHQTVEIPNMYYYLGRDSFAFNDLTDDQAVQKFHELKDRIDIVLCSAGQEATVRSDARFDRRVIISWRGMPRMCIYARKPVPIPPMSVDADAINPLFDTAYPWNNRIRDNYFSRPDTSFGQIILMREQKPEHRKKIKKYLHFLFD